jgi:hypothetical protein
MEMDMKAAQLITNRFAGLPTVLTTETVILGVTAAAWEKTWTGGFQHTLRKLEEYKKHVFESRAAQTK